MAWLVLGGLVALWVPATRVSLFALLPLYVVANMAPIPFAHSTAVYPDLGLGGVTRELPTCGDVLLLATGLLHRRVARELWGRRLTSALILLGIAAFVFGLVRAEVPVDVLAYLASMPVRLALMIAVLSAAYHERSPDWRFLGGIVLTAGMIWGSAVLMLAAQFTGLIHRSPFDHLIGDDGRLAFPTIGNNKIGLMLLLVTAAAGVVTARLRDKRATAIFGAMAVLALVTSGIAQLRFATTAFVLVVLVFGWFDARRRPATLLLGGIAAAAMASLGALPNLRALSVLTGQFSVSSDSSLSSRTHLWRAAVEIWRQSPLIGDLGRWEYDRPVHLYLLLGPLETHSELMWQLASFGLLGAAAILCVVAPPVRQALRHPMTPTSLAVLLAVGAMLLNVATYFPAVAVSLAALHVAATQGTTERRVNEEHGEEARATTAA